jgi:CheY-like chemotaxis protein
MNEKNNGIMKKNILKKHKVLVMDDVEMLRKVIRKILELSGYEVVTVDEGMAALKEYKIALDAGDPFDIVILDLTIPGGLGGKETLLKILELNPNAKVLASSGYANDEVMSNHEKYGFKGVVPKPYTMEELNSSLQLLIEDN